MKFKVWYEEATKTNNHVFTAQEIYEAGASSRQSEIDALQKRIDLALSAVWNDKCSHTVIDILKGDKND